MAIKRLDRQRLRTHAQSNTIADEIAVLKRLRHEHIVAFRDFQVCIRDPGSLRWLLLLTSARILSRILSPPAPVQRAVGTHYRRVLRRRRPGTVPARLRPPGGSTGALVLPATWCGAEVHWLLAPRLGVSNLASTTSCGQAATASGLWYLYVNKMVHRDLKPANVLLAHRATVAPPWPILKIGDFGFAAQHDDRATISGRYGSLIYMVRVRNHAHGLGLADSCAYGVVDVVLVKTASRRRRL